MAEDQSDDDDDDGDNLQGILSAVSLSHYFPIYIQVIFTILLLSTMGLLLFSNLNTAEYVNVIIKPTPLNGQQMLSGHPSFS